MTRVIHWLRKKLTLRRALREWRRQEKAFYQGKDLRR